ncbi:wall-associated receptor kinase-like 9 [Quercus suber]|uniref:Wall-associated receptor kinase-like 9 n=1 Tax=Quercus suber TaxID=58331 RepID=A0AAW0KMI9_QUESU
MKAKDGCEDHCGDVGIPYPFGTREGCYANDSFLITCNHTYNPPLAFLTDGNINVTDIWLSDIDECLNSTICVQNCTNLPGTYNCSCQLPGYDGDGKWDGTGCKLIPSPGRFPLINRISLGVSVSLLVLVLGVSWLYWGLKQRKLIKLKEKFFKQNGGFLLQQQLSKHNGSIEATQIFTAEELKKATNNYQENRILGQGGQGTVYKGILPDNKIVAIKKALSYLHSAASTPIIHRDIKSTNVLLDDNYRAKVSDFGASRLVPLDHTQLTTLVQGTLGYLDPEYFQSSQLTEKSDVYCFGVLLAELLTGMKALSFERPEEERNLAMHFVSSMNESRLFEILDQQMLNEGNVEQLNEVAMLAKRCLKVKERRGLL